MKPTLADDSFTDKAVAQAACILCETDHGITNAITLLIRPLDVRGDESGNHPGERFVMATLTREELREMVAWLDEDWAAQVVVTPDIVRRQDSADETERLRGVLLFLLWHHQGGSSEVGQTIRKALGIGPHDPGAGSGCAAIRRASNGSKKAMSEFLIRWKYRFICWFFDRPDALSRRVKVESALLAHAAAGTSPTPAECRALANILGVPKWWKR